MSDFLDRYETELAEMFGPERCPRDRCPVCWELLPARPDTVYPHDIGNRDPQAYNTKLCAGSFRGRR